MNADSKRTSRGILVLCATLAVSGPFAAICEASTAPLAYVGPGPGLSLIGSLLAVLAAIVLGLLGLVLYPLRLLRQWRRSRTEEAAASATAPADAQAAKESAVLSETPTAGR